MFSSLNLFYDITNTLMMLFEGWCAQKFFRVFAVPKFRFRWAKYAVGIVWAGINILCYFLLTNGENELTLLIKLIIYTLSLILFSVLWYGGGIMQRIFPAVLFASIRELAAQMANCLTVLNGFTIDILWYLADEKEMIPLDLFPSTVYIFTSVVIVLIVVFKEFIIYRIVRSIIKYYIHKHRLQKEQTFCLLPSVSAIMMCAMLRLILVSVENGYTTLIYQRYPLLYFIIPTASAMMLAVIVYSFKLYQEMTGLRQEQTDRAVLESQVAAMRNDLSEYENLRAFRHDIKNSIAALHGLILRKCPGDDEINNYFESMSLPFLQAENRVRTGNAVCDTIISSKFGAAQSEIENIKLDADGFFFTEEIKADPYDIGIILNNGLDNAYEACRRLKEQNPGAETFITVHSFKRQNMYFIEIENSFDGVLRTEKGNALPLSLKDGALHGIGLRNIRSCAEKYMGGIDIIVKNNTFILSVMLKA